MNYLLRKVYIRFKEDHPDGLNNFAAFDGFNQLGVETASFEGFGDIDTLDDLGPEVGLVGYVGDFWSALKKIGLSIPEPIDYPEELRPWFGREIWQTTLGQMRASTAQVFIKSVSEKLFTGFVWRSDKGDQLRVATLGDETELWASERVNFISEYRCFIKDDEILGARLYKGDWGVAIDRRTVEAAVSAFKSSPRAYALDFGATDNGHTLLVEVNDAYALGHYGLPSVQYAKLLEARWEELTRP